MGSRNLYFLIFVYPKLDAVAFGDQVKLGGQTVDNLFLSAFRFQTVLLNYLLLIIRGCEC